MNLFKITLIFTVLYANNLLAGEGKVLFPHLYAVEKNKEISYILGIQHYGINIEDYPEFVLNIFKKKPVFFREIIEMPEFSGKVDQFFKLPPRVQEALIKRGMSEDYVNQIDPNLICLAYETLEYRDGDMTNGELLDNQFEALAKVHGKDIQELDVDKTLLKKAVKEVIGSCNIVEKIESFPPDTVFQQVASIISEYGNKFKSDDEVTLLNSPVEDETTFLRNEVWAPILMRNHQKGFFAVVGADHLGLQYEKGLLSILKANDFKVYRVVKFLNH